MADLRALFSSNDPAESAEAFTNRQAQWVLVAAAVEEHLRTVASPGFDVEDLETPRSNVITFYGVGGVGKSTLLRKLEASLTSADQRPPQWGAGIGAGERLLPIRIDLSRSASTGSDFERVVLTIRLALAGAVGRPMPSFDLALRRYWDAAHPGEPLEEYLRRTGLLGKVGALLPGQLRDAVKEVAGQLQLPGMVGSAAGQVTTALVHALRKHQERARALAGATRTAALLEAAPDLDALSYYPHLLAWEIHQLPAKKALAPVILLDTFEDTADRHRDLERLLQRLVWLMPNVFFVIAGRNRLAWGEAGLEGQLDYTGPAAWPGLAPQAHQPAQGAGGRAQHLLGDFSTADCDSYLARRLTHDGQPLIGPDIRAVITARSHGLPLHLDLAVARFLELRRTGRTPTVTDFDHTFPALIARTLSDLTTDERHVLRSTSLLDAFDLDLATQAAGLTHQSAARRLVERPMISEDPYAIWPYHLHGAIRTALQDDDTHATDRWTPADWHQAATRALAALGSQWQHTSAGAAGGRAFLVACLRQGLRLARDHHLEDLAWLSEAAFAYVDDSVWEPIAPPAPAPAPGGGPAADTPADALAELLTAISRRQHEHREITARRLTALLDEGLLTPEMAELAWYYRAKAHKDLGLTGESLQGMQHVAATSGRMASRARRGIANLARIRGDFPTALAAVPTLGWTGRQHRVHGDILWPQGDFAAAIEVSEAGRAEAEQHQASGERAIEQTRLALVVAFTDPRRAEQEIDLARQLLEPLDQRATTLHLQVAALVRDAGTDRQIDDRVTVLRTEIEVAGLPWLIPLLELVVAFHHTIRRAEDDLTATIERLRAVTANGDFAYYADIAHYMSGRPLPAPSAVRWLHDEEAVRARWHRLAQARRSR